MKRDEQRQRFLYIYKAGKATTLLASCVGSRRGFQSTRTYKKFEETAKAGSDFSCKYALLRYNRLVQMNNRYSTCIIVFSCLYLFLCDAKALIVKRLLLSWIDCLGLFCNETQKLAYRSFLILYVFLI
jgi:hypothetical protein